MPVPAGLLLAGTDEGRGAGQYQGRHWAVHPDSARQRIACPTTVRRRNCGSCRLMPPLPVVSGAAAVAVFVSLGWRIDRRESSHVTLVKPGVPVALSIPPLR